MNKKIILSVTVMGKTLKVFDLQDRKFPKLGVKEAVFPFNMFPEVDPILRPEMRSTEEVLGIVGSFEESYYKGLEAAGQTLPMRGTVLITVSTLD